VDAAQEECPIFKVKASSTKWIKKLFEIYKINYNF